VSEPSLDRNSDRPLFKQVADALRRRIINGDLAPGESLPSERRLADDYNVGGTTVKDALMLLKAEGMVLSERGRPWWVAPAVTKMADRYAAGQRNYSPDVESNFAREHGVPWSRFGLDREYRVIAAPAEVARFLRLEAGATVCERRWTHSIEGVVLRVAWSYLDMAKFADTILTDIAEPPWPGGTIAQLDSLGYHVRATTERVGLVEVTADEAALLGCEAGALRLERWRVHLVQAMPDLPPQPIECARHVFAGTSTRLGYEVTATGGRGWMEWAEIAPD
jgi:GntR family transcriptional regulator